jgi:carbon dioxide concentrating mechanism protein CcmO
MNRSDDPYSELALGLISAQSFPAIVGIADVMLKQASVTLVGYEQIGSGYCTAVVRGRTPDVRLAIEMGAEMAEKFGQAATHVIIPRPMPNLEAVLPIGRRLAALAVGQENNRFRDQSIGLIETRGFPALVGASDAMLKSADVTFTAYYTTGGGLCTGIVRGNVSNVAAAIEIGMAEAQRIGELHAVMIVPRPLDDLERTLPIADCWIEQLQPVKMPLSVTVEEQIRQPLQPLELPIVEPLDPIEVERQERIPLRLEVENSVSDDPWMVSTPRPDAIPDATFNIAEALPTPPGTGPVQDPKSDLWDELDLDEQLKAIPLNAEALERQNQERQEQERQAERELEKIQREQDRQEQIKIAELLREKFQPFIEPVAEPAAEPIGSSIEEPAAEPVAESTNKPNKSAKGQKTSNSSEGKGFQGRSKRRNRKKR